MLDTVDALADRLLDTFACWGGPHGFARAVQSGAADACGLCAVVRSTRWIGSVPRPPTSPLRCGAPAVRRGMPAPRGALNVFCAREIERQRLETIVCIRRLTGASRSALADVADAVGIGFLRVFLPDQLRHARVVSAGLCIVCAQQPATNGQRCALCAATANARRRLEYQRRKAARICIRPGCGRASDGETVYCAEHRRQNAERCKVMRRAAG